MGEPNTIFDTTQARQSRIRAMERPEFPVFLDNLLVDELADHLGLINRQFNRTAIIGQTSRAQRQKLAAIGKLGHIISSPRDVAFDPAFLPFADESVDAIVAVQGLATVNDLVGTFIQARRALKGDGLFLAIMPCETTLTELRQAFAVSDQQTHGTPQARIAPFADIRQLGSLLQRAGFALPVADVARHRLRYASFNSLLQDLRDLGATNCLKTRQKTLSRRDTIAKAQDYYADNFADKDGKIQATLELAVLTGWAPHASQPKPLKPASAQVSLATVLTTSRAKKN